MAVNRHIITASAHQGGNFTAGKLPTITLENFGPSLEILPDSYCWLAFECQDLRRSTVTMECTVHFLPILLRAFADTVL